MASLIFDWIVHYDFNFQSQLWGCSYLATAEFHGVVIQFEADSWQLLNQYNGLSIGSLIRLVFWGVTGYIFSR